MTTNEPGTAPADPADVKMYAKEPVTVSTPEYHHPVPSTPPPPPPPPTPAAVYAAPAYLSPSYTPSYGYKPYSSYTLTKPSYYDEYKQPYESHRY